MISDDSQNMEKSARVDDEKVEPKQLFFQARTAKNLYLHKVLGLPFLFMKISSKSHCNTLNGSFIETSINISFIFTKLTLREIV